MMRGAVIQLAFGAWFGFVLANNGAADFDAMVRMFLFEEGHLFALAAGATVVSALGLALLLRSPWADGIRALPRDVHRGSVTGGLLFGVGWGLSGSCPGTALVQLGSGHVIAAFTIAGIVLGNWLFERVGGAWFGVERDSCN
jgi:uncharacterized membrane protein YedE/YeeE